MGIKKYLSLDKLDLFYEKLKVKISSDNASTLDSAKSYTNQELDGFAGEMNKAIDLLDTAIDGKADSVHAHSISQVDGLQAELNAKEEKGASETALTSAKAYTDGQIEEAMNNIVVNKTSLKYLPLQTASTEGQTVFTLDNSFNVDTDTLVLVQSGITMLYPDADFIVSGRTVTLTKGVPLGRTIGFYIMRSEFVNVSDITLYNNISYGIEDLETGVSPLNEGHIYFVYE